MNTFKRRQYVPTLLKMLEMRNIFKALANNPNYRMYQSGDNYDDMVWLTRRINEYLRFSQSPIVKKEKLIENILQIPHIRTTIIPNTDFWQHEYYDPKVKKYGGPINRFDEGGALGITDDNPNESEYYYRNYNGTWTPKPGVQYGENYNYAVNIEGNWYWQDKEGDYVDQQGKRAYPQATIKEGVTPPVSINGCSSSNWLWDRADDERTSYNEQHGTNLRLNRQGNVTGDYAYFAMPLMATMTLPAVSMAGTGALASTLDAVGSGFGVVGRGFGNTVRMLGTKAQPWAQAFKKTLPWMTGYTGANLLVKGVTGTTPTEKISEGLKYIGSSPVVANTVAPLLDPMSYLPWGRPVNYLTNTLFGYPTSTPLVYNSVVSKPSVTLKENYTDFNIMVERMNSYVEYNGTNPFKDGKMTGFRKWALDNGADTDKILEVEAKYSKNNWEVLKKYSIAKDDFSGAGNGFVQIYEDIPYFNQIFPHEVEHRLYAELFGMKGKSIPVEDVTRAFEKSIWKIPENSSPDAEPYFMKNDFEEIFTRFTQIKNALGIKEQRALTGSELRNAFEMFKNGDPRLVTDNLKDFFENIKDWDAAAKLSKYALGITGSVPLILNTADNEEELQDYR